MVNSILGLPSRLVRMTEADFLALEQPARGYALVGYYLAAFSDFEAFVGQLLGTLLGTDDDQTDIIRRHLGFMEKMKALKSLAFYGIEDQTERQRCIDLIATRAMAFSSERNVIAHSQVWVEKQGEGVVVWAYDANGEITREREPARSVANMLGRVRKLIEARSELQQIQVNFHLANYRSRTARRRSQDGAAVDSLGRFSDEMEGLIAEGMGELHRSGAVNDTTWLNETD